MIDFRAQTLRYLYGMVHFLSAEGWVGAEKHFIPNTLVSTINFYKQRYVRNGRAKILAVVFYFQAVLTINLSKRSRQEQSAMQRKRGVSYSSESIATLPPFGPLEGHKWFFPDFQPMRVAEEPVCIYLSA